MDIIIEKDPAGGNNYYVTGKTFKYRHILKQFGGRWDPKNKRWVMSRQYLSPENLLERIEVSEGVYYRGRRGGPVENYVPWPNQQGIYITTQVQRPRKNMKFELYDEEDNLLVSGIIVSINYKINRGGKTTVIGAFGQIDDNRAYKFVLRNGVWGFEDGDILGRVEFIDAEYQTVTPYKIIYRPRVGDTITIKYEDGTIDQFEISSIQKSKNKKSIFKKKPNLLVVGAELVPIKDNVYPTEKLLLRNGEWVQNLTDVPPYTIHEQ